MEGGWWEPGSDRKLVSTRYGLQVTDTHGTAPPAGGPPAGTPVPRSWLLHTVLQEKTRGSLESRLTLGLRQAGKTNLEPRKEGPPAPTEKALPTAQAGTPCAARTSAGASPPHRTHTQERS